MAEEKGAGDAPPIKLLHIFPTFGVGGQQQRLATLVGVLGDDFQHVIISLSPDTSSAASLPESAHTAVEIVETPKSTFISRAAVRCLKEVIETQDPDIVCTYNWGAIEGVLANKTGDKRPHIHFEDGFGPDENLETQKLQRMLTRRFLLRRSFVVVPSKGLRNLALSRWKLPEQCVRYIPNGIDTNRFAVSRDYDRSAPVIGSVGTIRREKNFERLLRTFKMLDMDTSARLEIHGDGPEYSTLAELAKTTPNVSLPGQNNHPEQAYAAFDIFAMSSDTEQMPLSLMEAMASGLPVAATDVGDIVEMVSPENRRFITAKDDEAALAASLKELVRTPVLRRELGEANLAKAQSDFSLEVMVQSHRDLYRSVLS